MKKIICMMLVLFISLVVCGSKDYGIFTKDTYKTLTDEQKDSINNTYNSMLEFAKAVKGERYKEAQSLILDMDYGSAGTQSSFDSIIMFADITIIFMEMRRGAFNTGIWANREEDYNLSRIKLLEYLNEDAVNELIISSMQIDEYKENLFKD